LELFSKQTIVTPDTGLYANGQITTSQNLTLSGLAVSGATVTLSRAGVGVLGSVTANGSGVWTYDYSATTLAEGCGSRKRHRRFESTRPGSVCAALAIGSRNVRPVIDLITGSK
jgi:hypothetical protein